MSYTLRVCAKERGRTHLPLIVVQKAFIKVLYFYGFLLLLLLKLGTSNRHLEMREFVNLQKATGVNEALL